MEAEKETSHHPCLASLDAKHEHMFLVPTKRIHEVQDVSHFLTSRAYGDLMTFLLQLNRALFPQKVKTNDQNPEVRVWQLGMSRYNFSDTVKRLQRLLNQIEALIDEIPPDEGPRRFGNVSFRKWYQRVESSASELLQDHLPSSSIKSTPSGSSIPEEILPYFLGSFGSAQRLDYGSGHELSFFAFLGCIWKLGGFENQPSASEAPSFNEDDQSRGIVLGILADYFRLIRRLIKTYTLEPAGSHGVWGLDDHSFLPYIFGSAQNGPPISESDRTPTEGSRKGAPNPADVAKASIVEQHRDQDLYFGAIGFIYDVKKGPFWEHSPMLYDISGVQAGWGKINKVGHSHDSPRTSFQKERSSGAISHRKADIPQSGHDQNVRGRSPRQVPRRATFPLRLPLQLGNRSPRPGPSKQRPYV